jgi:hypothetical protein
MRRPISFAPYDTLDEGVVLGNELCFFSANLGLLRRALFRNFVPA